METIQSLAEAYGVCEKTMRIRLREVPNLLLFRRKRKGNKRSRYVWPSDMQKIIDELGEPIKRKII